MYTVNFFQTYYGTKDLIECETWVAPASSLDLSWGSVYWGTGKRVEIYSRDTASIQRREKTILQEREYQSGSHCALSLWRGYFRLL